MLDGYKNTQPIVYKILKNAILNDKCSHAYLIETSGFYDYYNFVMAFVKSVLCPSKKLTKENCGNCHQCEVIDSKNFPEIQIISPDGLWIKKEQLQNLQKEFNTKPLIGNKRIYIIKNAEKLNKASANSILKFLEEPDNNIIAILLTDNIYAILPTIKSRCQILKLKESDISKENINYIQKLKKIINFDSEKSDIKIQKVIEFVNYYEKNHLNTLLYLGKIWYEYITNKEETIYAYEIMIYYYKDILNYKIKNHLEIFENNENIQTISNSNTKEELCQKINILTSLKELIKYNINLNLLMDKLIINLEEVI